MCIYNVLYTYRFPLFWNIRNNYEILDNDCNQDTDHLHMHQFIQYVGIYS